MERARFVKNTRATKCDKYNNKLNLLVNLFHRDNEFEDFCIIELEFEPSSSDSEAVYKLHVISNKGIEKSFSCLYHSNMVWVAFKRYIRNMINKECCICYDTIQKNTLYCAQCCCITCVDCFAKKLVIQRSASCSMCNYVEPVTNDLVEAVEKYSVTVEDMVNALKQLAKKPLTK
jgi:hypothetical protein